MLRAPGVPTLAVDWPQVGREIFLKSLSFMLLLPGFPCQILPPFPWDLQSSPLGPGPCVVQTFPVPGIWMTLMGGDPGITT